MPRRLLTVLRSRLDRSPLPLTDPVRLELEAELVVLLTREQRLANARALRFRVNAAGGDA